MTTEQQIKALAELDGKPTPHKPTWKEIAEGSYAQFEPAYLTSYDAIVPLIQRQGNIIKHDFLECLIAIVHPSGFQGDYDSMTIMPLMTATPAQLCEALLRATGKWEE